ncbi:MAG: transcriptional regulator [Candidatus Pacebacteria bacterium]|jgi:TrpR-related protein YerC/YecD|nr:transcriptional regulator [Candidatus Paceibacterota bacterium]MBT3511975.1 transcriptional regulator [Candidatus Paceibacterota bacterium]MBT4005297.1 transcriptional regulator [Candidatus Paceibacterota bacterium]MBT4358516.1 transcriptional regulator [Candidatus Paceibacterota bacterium]MBT4681164.1 transcriptional regulator [Candidatus Paceibacterota bacterium]
MIKQTDDLLAAFEQLKNKKEIKNFLRDLLSPAEKDEFETRFQIAKLLWTTEMSYAKIAQKLNTSTTTVTRVARFLHKEPYKGYKTVLERLYPQKS